MATNFYQTANAFLSSNNENVIMEKNKTKMSQNQSKRVLGDITNNLQQSQAALAIKQQNRRHQIKPLPQKVRLVSQEFKPQDRQSSSSLSSSDPFSRDSYASSNLTGSAGDIDALISAHTLHQLQIQDIDYEDKVERNEPSVAEYVEEIYRNFKKRETLYLPDPYYIENQSDISEKMRAVLVDWLVDVHQKYKLSEETFFLAINILDRYLSMKAVLRTKLQLLGIVSIMIAAKYEEIYPPDVNDYHYITDGAYTKEEIIRMEAHVLNVLHFDITVPSPHCFLLRFLKAAKHQNDLPCLHIATYYLYLASQSYQLVGATPSELAAASCHLAGKFTGKFQWDSTMVHHTGYTEEKLEKSTVELLMLQKEDKNEAKLTAVKRKFSKEKYSQVYKVLA